MDTCGQDTPSHHGGELRTLTDPQQRADYDTAMQLQAATAAPLSSTVDFMDNVDGELNRRLALLAVLYYKRRTDPHSPQISLLEIESRMGFPRDYLDFTIWYLQKKGYITRADNSDFTLTVDGVDFVEIQRRNIPVLNKLLTNETGATITPPRPPEVIILPEYLETLQSQSNENPEFSHPK